MMDALAIAPSLLPTAGDMRGLLPELLLCAGIVGVLLAPFFGGNIRVRSVLPAIASVVAALAVAVAYPVNGTSAFGGLIQVDGLAHAWRVLLLSSLLITLFAWLLADTSGVADGDSPIFLSLLMGSALGMSFMGMASNLLMMVLAMELAGLPSYLLVGFNKARRQSSEGALKYVVFGAAATAVMVFGVSILYGATGTLDTGVCAWSAKGPVGIMLAGLLAVMCGLFFKISVVPFHFWCPDAFEAAGAEVAGFLSVASKGAALVLLVRFLGSVAEAGWFATGTVNQTLAWTCGIVGAVTSTWANTAALGQQRVRRLLAWSSIAHAGYMLSLLAILPSGGGASETIVKGILVYLAVYVVMNLGAFLVTGLMVRMMGDDQLYHFRGLARTCPVLAAGLTICLFSLVGLPPLAGFGAKLNLMLSLPRAGALGWVLMASIGLNTAISLFFYLKPIRAMYMEEPTAIPEGSRPPLGGAVLVSVLGVALLSLMLGFGSLLRWADVGLPWVH